MYQYVSSVVIFELLDPSELKNPLKYFCMRTFPSVVLTFVIYTVVSGPLRNLKCLNL